MSRLVSIFEGIGVVGREGSRGLVFSHLQLCIAAKVISAIVNRAVVLVPYDHSGKVS